MKKLYQIWCLQTNVYNGKGYPKYCNYDAELKTVEYPLVAVMSGMSDRFSRKDFIGTDLEHLIENCNYFNYIRASDEYYEVREVQELT